MVAFLQILAFVLSVDIGSMARIAPELATPEVERPAPIVFGKPAPVPRGFYDLCLRTADHCRPIPARGVVQTSGGAVVLTPRLAAEMVEVDRAINSRLRPLSDRAAFGVADRWTVGGKSGDCEDYALTKQHELIERGWPSSALLVALVRTPKGQQHAVLLVVTDRGVVVLDNLDRKPKDWRKTAYRFEKVQSPGDPWTWTTL